MPRHARQMHDSTTKTRVAGCNICQPVAVLGGATGLGAEDPSHCSLCKGHGTGTEYTQKDFTLYPKSVYTS
jgi:hypothetical protein